MLLMRRDEPSGQRTSIDLPGAALVASGTFLVVFALSQGPTYGWLRPHEAFHVAGLEAWPTSMPISVVAAAFLVGLILLAAFVRMELTKERKDRNPLFEFSQMRRPTFRYGLITTTIAALGQLGLLFCIPLFLQGANNLSAQENGLWLLPLGIGVILGAQGGGKLSQRVGVTNVIRAGFFIEVGALLLLIPALHPGVTFWRILPCLLLYGMGSGVVSSQLTNVVLWGIPRDKSGVAGGANSTSRQIGAALGAAVIGTLLTVHTVSSAVSAVQAARLPEGTTDAAVSGVKAMGVNWQPGPGLSLDQANTLNHLFDDAVSSGARWALGFATVMLLAGGIISFLIPQIRHGEEEIVVLEGQPVTEVEPLVLDLP
jgi:hypothetical protein